MKANPEWIKVWQTDLQANIAVIIHVDGDPQQYTTRLGEWGMSVVRAFRLTQTIAANGPAHCVLDLLDAPWIAKIELDQKITTMKRG